MSNRTFQFAGLADMSLPAPLRRRRRRGRLGGTPPAQMDHAMGPRARKHAREGEKRLAAQEQRS